MPRAHVGMALVLVQHLDPTQESMLTRYRVYVGSILVIPLLREESIGWALFHYRSSSLTLGDSETDFARRLGTLMSFTFENARLYATQREIADTLQAALLAVPRRIPGIDFGYLCRSATTSAAVGGGFYDLFELEGSCVGIVLGDVSGKGVQAATLTSLVKNTIRALAYEDESPATVLGKTQRGHPEGQDGDRGWRPPGAVHRRRDRSSQGGGNVRRGASRRIRASMETLRPGKVPQTIFDEVLRFAVGKLSDDVAIVSLARARKG